MSVWAAITIIIVVFIIVLISLFIGYALGLRTREE